MLTTAIYPQYNCHQRRHAFTCQSVLPENHSCNTDNDCPQAATLGLHDTYCHNTYGGQRHLWDERKIAMCNSWQLLLCLLSSLVAARQTVRQTGNLTVWQLGRQAELGHQFTGEQSTAQLLANCIFCSFSLLFCFPFNLQPAGCHASTREDVAEIWQISCTWPWKECSKLKTSRI